MVQFSSVICLYQFNKWLISVYVPFGHEAHQFHYPVHSRKNSI